MFSKALLNATYINGKPSSKLTPEHEKAEHHRFKEEVLFKNPKIPKAPYVSRVIQQFLIIQAIELQLQCIHELDPKAISAFFALSYLEELWRTSPMAQDLKILGVNPDEITPEKITKSTSQYIEHLKTLNPKVLLAHFVLHVAGFMHGGYIVRSQHITPSNKLTDYQIPTNQYDFSKIEIKPTLRVYSDMMGHLNKGIELTEDEYEEILQECKNIYAVMSCIYDDLYDMHVQHPPAAIPLSVSFLVVALIVKVLGEYLFPELNFWAPGPR